MLAEYAITMDVIDDASNMQKGIQLAAIKKNRNMKVANVHLRRRTWRVNGRVIVVFGVARVSLRNQTHARRWDGGRDFGLCAAWS
jgi:hypothetical protein